MPRPEKCRFITHHQGVTFFKPVGIPLNRLEQVDLSRDELEAIRLADLEGLSQEEGAARMNISRATFGRIAARARQKVAEALVRGRAIHITGGSVEIRPRPPLRQGHHGRRRMRGGRRGRTDR